ncbi:clarin-2-like [Panonychus citri]|uniref:clarin-2-like n=1 Tax=Panonychus citri TaxID=50023 RepID=UPI002307F3C5|nr:clarin-2-like [Panonychus citri]
MERTKRIAAFITFFICIIALALLTGSLTTNKWITSKPERIRLNNVPDHIRNQSVQSDERKFKGDIHFGLFHGTKILNYGFGDRTNSIWIKEELMKNPSLMPFGLWLFTILSVAIAMLFGLVSLIFSIINTVITPIEVITGLRGLLLWNGFGVLFSGAACLSWFIQFRNKLSRNVLTQEEINDGWSSENRSKLGYSYYLVLVSMGLFFLNKFIILLAVKRPRFRGKSRLSTDKNPEGVIMLY